jgi:hypothetical protein
MTDNFHVHHIVPYKNKKRTIKNQCTFGDATGKDRVVIIGDNASTKGEEDST